MRGNNGSQQGGGVGCKTVTKRKVKGKVAEGNKRREGSTEEGEREGR